MIKTGCCLTAASPGIKSSCLHLCGEVDPYDFSLIVAFGVRPSSPLLTSHTARATVRVVSGERPSSVSSAMIRLLMKVLQQILLTGYPS